MCGQWLVWSSPRIKYKTTAARENFFERVISQLKVIYQLKVISQQKSHLGKVRDNINFAIVGGDSLIRWLLINAIGSSALTWLVCLIAAVAEHKQTNSQLYK